VIEKADGTVYGEGVNIAARLEGLALPGGVTISDAAHAAVRHRVAATFEDLGEQQVKNITDPVRAFRVLQANPQAVGAGAAGPSASVRLPDRLVVGEQSLAGGDVVAADKHDARPVEARAADRRRSGQMAHHESAASEARNHWPHFSGSEPIDNGTAEEEIVAALLVERRTLNLTEAG
jgi:hypothetical protein